MHKIYLITAWLFCAYSITAQELRITWVNQAFSLDKKFFSAALQDSLSISALRFYVSDVRFWQGDSLVYQLPKKTWLVDAADPATLQQTLPTLRPYNRISFNFGLDSLTNVNNDLSGNLDPINGMFWTWQSGYINFKMEGQTAACPTRNHEFSWHLGGYLSPFCAWQRVSLSSTKPFIYLPIDAIFDTIQPAKTPNIMSPSAQAVSLSAHIAQLFTTTIDEKK